MAETNPKPQQPEMAQTEEEKLKYLEFLQVAMIHAALYVAKVYGYAKENSGPLKPGVQTVEGTVKTVVGPVYDRFHDVPVEVLKFVDRKVDQSVRRIETHVPPMVKQAPAAARSVAADVKSAGVMGAASGLAKTVYAKYEPTAKGLYTKYEPMAEQYAASAWLSLNKFPIVPKVTQAVAPTAAYYSEKYNVMVQQTAEKGYKVASYLPLVPTEKIAKVEKSESYSEDIDNDPPPDLPSMLLHGRIVYIGMPLVAEVTELVVAQLLYLQYMDPKEPIYLYINSTGTTRDDGEAVGMESEGFAIYDSLMQLENEIHTVGVGAAIGQACLLLAAGTKGKRFMMPHAKAMIQQPRAPSAGLMQASDVAIRAREVLINRDTLVKLLAKHTENSEEMVANAMRRPYYMDATKAREFGVIDKILWPGQEDAKIIADVADAL